MELTQSEKDTLLAKLIELIEANLSNDHFGVSELAREMGMSRSNLHRKVKILTNLTVSQFIRGLRLRRALELLRRSSMTISEVAYESGFSSLNYFTKCFNDYYGVPPSKFSRIEVTVSFPQDIRIPREKKKLRSIKASHIWITGALLIAISTVLLVLFLNPDRTNPGINAKTIAVLPVIDPNPDEVNAFLVDGLVNELRYRLSLVGDLTILSRTSVEGYRQSGKSVEAIGKELNVNYILECGAQNFQGRTWIGLQLFDVVNNSYLWSEPYEKEISLENILEVQREVTLAVSDDLKAELTSEDKERIERIPTENIVAYNKYLLGKDYRNIQMYSIDDGIRSDAFLKAIQLFEEAIELDSTFADAYSALASIYTKELYDMVKYSDMDIRRSYLDSGMALVDKALLYDPENLFALKKKADCYMKMGLNREAGRIYKKLSKRAEPGYEYYEDQVMQFHVIKDYYGTLESYRKYLQLKPEGRITPRWIVKRKVWIFQQTGYPELARQMAKQEYHFHYDTSLYLRRLAGIEIYQGNFQTALDCAREAVKLDSSKASYCDLIALCYVYLEDYANALDYLVLTEDSKRRQGPVERPGYIPGYIYLVNGYETEARYHFKQAIDRRLKEIEYSTHRAQQCQSHFYLAGTYLALGNEEKALEYFKALKNLEAIDYGFINMMIHWPGFESIRERSEFQDVLTDLEKNFQKQHNQIGKLIEKMDIHQL